MVKRRILMAISLLAIALASVIVKGIYPSAHIEEVIPGDRQLTINWIPATYEKSLGFGCISCSREHPDFDGFNVYCYQDSLIYAKHGRNEDSLAPYLQNEVPVKGDTYTVENLTNDTLYYLHINEIWDGHLSQPSNMVEGIPREASP